MKNLLMFLIFVSFGLSSTLNAQNLQGKFCLAPYGGLAFPLGDFADDDWEDNHDSWYRAMGYQFGLFADYFFSPNFGIGLQFKYVSLPSKDYDILSKPDQDDVMTLIMIGVNGKGVFIAEGPVRPYGKFGLGILMSSISDFPAVDFQRHVYYISDIEIDTELYLQFGAGLEFFVSPQVSIFLESTYDYLLLDGTEFEITDISRKDEFETDFSSLSVMVGLNIWLGGNN